MKIDTITKDYVKDTDIFADIFNYYIYGGRQVIQPNQLTECDSAKTVLPYDPNGAVIPFQRFRDVQKLYAAMTDGKAEYVLCGAENQAEIHYAMAVKNNLYDALDYAGQVETTAKSHRAKTKNKSAYDQQTKQGRTAPDKENKTPNSGEFLSGFWKEDRLIAPAQMTDDEIMKFQSSLREVMFFIKYSKEPENLKRILESDAKRFREVERRAVDVIEAVTNAGLKYNEDEEAVDMCKAIQEMRLESERNGELTKAREVAKNFYNLGLDVEKIAQGVGYTVDTVKEWLNID